MPHSETTALTPVEAKALDASPFKALYPPREKITTLVVDSFPALGRLAAMRFLEWAQNNPGGVISLPTGKTLEHFIKWVMRALAEWTRPRCRGSVSQLTAAAWDRLVAKIERGMTTRPHMRFLRTEPHHDDIMLGHLPYIVRHVRDASNTHHFTCFTGGFTAVTNRFILGHMEAVRGRLDAFERYFASRYPGQKDSDDMQRLKSMCRERDGPLWASRPGGAPVGWRTDLTRF